MTEDKSILFTIGSYSFKYYTLFILIAVLLGYLLFMHEGKKHQVDKDFLFNVAFWSVIFGILGARIYYVIFNFALYKDDLLSMFKVWEGGLAIHGGLLFGLIALIIYCKKYKFSVVRLLDFAVPSVILGQAIGRWGNFFNGEAHGAVTTLAHLKSLHIPQFIIDGMHIGGVYYEPTFLYESLWCLLGFLIILIIRKRKYLKIGNLLAFYLVWYGIGRFFIESLRTDSLMLGSFKMAQIVSVFMAVIGIFIFIFNAKKGKFENLYSTDESNSVRF